MKTQWNEKTKKWSITNITMGEMNAIVHAMLIANDAVIWDENEQCYRVVDEAGGYKVPEEIMEIIFNYI